MKVALISWDYTTQVYPLRILATILSKKDIKVKIVLATSYFEQMANLDNMEIINKKSQGIIKIIEDCDVVGLSFLTIHKKMAKILAEKIKKKYPDKFIISGNIHASAVPEEALKYSDYVCVGEGEKSFPAFLKAIANNGNPSYIKGIIGKNDSIDNIFASDIIENLDSIPIPDFFFKNTYVYIPDQETWVLRDEKKLCL